MNSSHIAQTSSDKNNNPLANSLIYADKENKQILTVRNTHIG